MPRLIAEKLQLYQDIEHYLSKKGGAGDQGHHVWEHLKAVGWDVAAHVVNHALNQMVKEGRLTKWGSGRGTVWVSKHEQEKRNEEAAPLVVTPNLVVDIVKSTGRVRLEFGGLIIEIGVKE